MAEEKRLLHFAFGSNLQEKQRNKRLSEYGDLPSGEKVILNDYEICFHKVTKREPGYGYATIRPSPDQTVQGLLIGLNHQQITNLDKDEGFNANPPHYTKKKVIVQTDDGAEYSAFAYIAHSSRIDTSLRPSTGYLQKIVEGAREIGLDDWYIEKLESFE